MKPVFIMLNNNHDIKTAKSAETFSALFWIKYSGFFFTRLFGLLDYKENPESSSQHGWYGSGEHKDPLIGKHGNNHKTHWKSD
ncbi:hypothetical protein [Planomicrobium okeanokoites]|uniref:hypothetical protein n=1 Tax=Planomicrobium okeanokoites TaxID=244 RepID=UPI0024929CB0|nr:hypothetical protein [Planomicrobium okeanokoites]